ncbi:HesA/MoeB/ThiF family protein [Sphaerisporangium dianthi]|uniref:HesA/MoeB/ThiF family protein n=1 Tax=Sphaerisporangium dianthi TaxID=1436120 RepID=A0ABV9CS61_9ACTN
MRRPRVKHPHRPRRLGTDRVTIGGTVYKIAAEMRDPDGWIWAMLELLDGTRTVDQVVGHLVHRFPQYTERELREGFDRLAATGYLEDADEPAPPDLTAAEQERYSRSRSFFQWVDLAPRESSWDHQRRLRDAKVVLVGVGGTGGAAALALAASGVGALHCVEPDVVELSNLNRQILYTEADIGRPKVEAALERLRALNSEIQVTGTRREVRTAEEFIDVLQGYDMLVLGGDRPADIRGLANEACLKVGVPWVYGGYHGPQITAGVFRPGSGPCYECVRVADARGRDTGSPQLGWAGEPPVHAATAISAGMSGNLVAHAALALLTGVPRLPVNCAYGMNLAAPAHSFVITTGAPLPGCPACGGAA